jgi:hypothetical protein
MLNRVARIMRSLRTVVSLLLSIFFIYSGLSWAQGLGTLQGIPVPPRLLRIRIDEVIADRSPAAARLPRTLQKC